MTDAATLAPQVERLATTVETLSTLVTAATTAADYTRAALAEDRQLLLSALRLLRGDEQGGGGLTARLIVCEEKITALTVRLDHDERMQMEERRMMKTRRWQLLVAILSSGAVAATALHFLDLLTNRK